MVLEYNDGNTIFSTQLQKQNTAFYPTQTIRFTYQHDAVMDEKRGYLIYKNNAWNFLGINQYNNQAITKQGKKLIIILESPHKDEFSCIGVPLRPANGVTGARINQKLGERNFTNNLNKESVYEVWIVNAIQYQASCHFFLHLQQQYSNNRSFITEKVFRWLFSKGPKLKDDFSKRIIGLTPDYILNASTYRTKDLIRTELISKKIVPGVKKAKGKKRINSVNQYFEDIHPSFW